MFTLVVIADGVTYPLQNLLNNRLGIARDLITSTLLPSLIVPSQFNHKEARPLLICVRSLLY